MPTGLTALRSLRKAEVNAVDDEGLSELLESLGLSGELNQGRLRCINCHDVITAETLQAIIPHGNQIAVVCWKPPCIQAAVEEGIG